MGAEPLFRHEASYVQRGSSLDGPAEGVLAPRPGHHGHLRRPTGPGVNQRIAGVPSKALLAANPVIRPSVTLRAQSGLGKTVRAQAAAGCSAPRVRSRSRLLTAAAGGGSLRSSAGADRTPRSPPRPQPLQRRRRLGPNAAWASSRFLAVPSVARGCWLRTDSAHVP